jgi:hypothetical protein
LGRRCAADIGNGLAEYASQQVSDQNREIIGLLIICISRKQYFQKSSVTRPRFNRSCIVDALLGSAH